MFLLNGNILRVDTPFTVNGINYPQNWLRLSSEAEKIAIGITWQADPVRADDRFYWNGDVNLPKELEDRLEVDENGYPVYVLDTTEQLVTPGLKTNWTHQVKHTAGTMLSESDWYVTRKAERDVAIPSAITDKRNAIRAECDRLEAAIAAATNIDEFIAVVNDQRWPRDE